MHLLDELDCCFVIRGESVVPKSYTRSLTSARSAMENNLSQLTRDLEHAMQVIVALRHALRERDIVPPQSLFDASDQAITELGAWKNAIEERRLIQ